MNSFEVAFAKKLAERLQEDRKEKLENLAKGSAKRKQYHYDCGYIKALENIYDMAINVERQLTNPQPLEKKKTGVR